MKQYEIWVRYYGPDDNTLHQHHGQTGGHDINDAIQVFMLIMRTEHGAMIPEATGLSIDIKQVTAEP